jgi:hypothetical protein
MDKQKLIQRSIATIKTLATMLAASNWMATIA